MGTHLGVSLLDLTGLLGEDDKASLVLLETLDVELEGLLGLVAATVVDGDTDGESLLAADTGSRELGGGEATALTNLAVVADGRGADDRAEELSGPAKKNEDVNNSTAGVKALLPPSQRLRLLRPPLLSPSFRNKTNRAEVRLRGGSHTRPDSAPSQTAPSPSCTEQHHLLVPAVPSAPT